MYFVIHLHGEMYFPIHPLVDVFNTFTSGCIFFFEIFKWSGPKGASGVKKIFQKKIHPRVNVLNTSTSGCIGKYISPVKMYNKIRNSQIYVKIKIIRNITTKMDFDS